ncbi:MAG TPA: class I SAM-dependent methyltransferase [Vicinamibacterales bacterium]|jgi:SAM-dependent methyltransferase
MSTSSSTDPFAGFKAAQRQGWSTFAPLENQTTPTAARLANHAGIREGQRVLDVACGTAVVAITAARRGATVTALDLTPELLARARENATIAGVAVDFHEGDVEQLPFEPSTFDVVVSQFGHIFAPRPDVAIAQMLRVLKPGGTIAFSTWPPELCLGRIFALTARFGPPLPPGVPPPVLWGDPNVVRERLGSAVKDLVFDRGTMLVSALSPAHHRDVTERTAGPMRKIVEVLSASDPARLAEFRSQYEAIISEYLKDNQVRQDYLMTRATRI